METRDTQPPETPTCMHGVPSPCGICGEFTEDRWQAAKQQAAKGSATGRALRIALRLAEAVAAGLVIAVCVAVLITIRRDQSPQPLYVPATFGPSPAATAPCPAGQHLTASPFAGIPECAP